MMLSPWALLLPGGGRGHSGREEDERHAHSSDAKFTDFIFSQKDVFVFLLNNPPPHLCLVVYKCSDQQ